MQWITSGKAKELFGNESSVTLKATVITVPDGYAWFEILTDVDSDKNWNNVVKIIDEQTTSVDKVYTVTITEDKEVKLSTYLEKGILVAGEKGMKVKLEYIVGDDKEAGDQEKDDGNDKEAGDQEKDDGDDEEDGGIVTDDGEEDGDDDDKTPPESSGENDDDESGNDEAGTVLKSEEVKVTEDAAVSFITADELSKVSSLTIKVTDASSTGDGTWSFKIYSSTSWSENGVTDIKWTGKDSNDKDVYELTISDDDLEKYKSTGIFIYAWPQTMTATVTATYE